MLRVRSLGGRWSGVAAGGAGGRRRARPGLARSGDASGWHLGNPWWVGPSNRLEIARRQVRRPCPSPPRLEPRDPNPVPGACSDQGVRRDRDAHHRPAAAWGADESIRRSPPTYAPSVRFAIVHHTAGTNDYSRAEAAAIVEAIQLYHVQGNGWNDIGYNFLVDRFGTIYEGRYGGIDRNVVGAHALGFNTGSVGIALLGTYGDAKPTRAAQERSHDLLAWRLDLAHVDPPRLLTFISGGSERYRPSIPVLLSAVSGHRDTGLTECPGDALYAQLAAIAAEAASSEGRRSSTPRHGGRGRAASAFRARLSQRCPGPSW